MEEKLEIIQVKSLIGLSKYNVSIILISFFACFSET